MKRTGSRLAWAALAAAAFVVVAWLGPMPTTLEAQDDDAQILSIDHYVKVRSAVR